MTSFLAPPNEFEREGIAKIRQIFGDELPSDIDTDFNLQRWVRGWKGDMKQIEPRLRMYIQNRKILKMDGPDFLTQPLHPLVRRAFKYLSLSVRENPLVNPLDNTVVVIYRLENVDLVGLSKLFTTTEYLHFTFLMTEIILRQVLIQESVSGKPSGISMIYDMHGIHLGDFLNPSAPHMKLASLAMAIQQDYYCDFLHQIVCVRVPAFMNILWEITKKFLNEQTQKKFCMYTEHKYRQHIFDHIHPSCVPVFYGGEYTESQQTTNRELQYLNIDAEKAASIPDHPVPESEYFKNSWTPSEWTMQHIRPKQTMTVVKSVKEAEKTTLRWQFEAHYNVEFAIYHQKDGQPRQLIIPKFTICTPNIPEEGHLCCRDHGPGDYIFEFTNLGTSWFSLKVPYCIKECEE